MARAINRLNALAVARLKEPGRHSDGGGLYLVVDKGGAKRWVFLFRWEGRLREMGLGGLVAVSLAKAREKAAAAREQVADGVDPITDRRAGSAPVTFGAFADQWLTDIEHEWRNQKHRDQWRMTLTEYAKPLRELPIDAVTTDDIVAVLKPIWKEKPETASRLRGRIERVLGAAGARGLRTGDNPARWRGHLKELLPKPDKLSRGHHAALPFKEAPAFVAKLRARPAMAARALEFTILTAARSGETLGARWLEIDWEARVWTVPPERMKAKRQHRVPLTDAALAILRPLAELRESDLVFPGQQRGRPLSGMAMEMMLRRMATPVTVHGFRSSFRDWVGEETDFAREVAEAALAHVVGDETERAYRRGDALGRRRALMDAWSAFCAGAEGGAETAAGHAGEHRAEDVKGETPSPI